MRKTKLFISLLSIILFASSCMSAMKEQKITIQKRSSEMELFEDYREVTQNKDVKKAIDIVKNAKWENSKVQMARFADYQFQFPFKDDSDAKIASYLLWVSPNGTNLEIVADSNKYVKLSNQESAELFKILTGEALTEYSSKRLIENGGE